MCILAGFRKEKWKMVAAYINILAISLQSSPLQSVT